MEVFFNAFEFLTQKLPKFLGSIWAFLNIPIDVNVGFASFTIEPLMIFSVGGLATVMAIWALRG